jgi:hypothetical protein
VDYLPAGGRGHTGLLRALASGQAERGQGGFRCIRLGGSRLPGAEVTAQVLQRHWPPPGRAPPVVGPPRPGRRRRHRPRPPRTEPMMGQQGGMTSGTGAPYQRPATGAVSWHPCRCRDRRAGHAGSRKERGELQLYGRQSAISVRGGCPLPGGGSVSSAAVPGLSAHRQRTVDSARQPKRLLMRAAFLGAAGSRCHHGRYG